MHLSSLRSPGASSAKQHVVKLRSRRYDLGVWGQAGGRRKRVIVEDTAALDQMRLDNERDLDRCRLLLADIPEERLRTILTQSRYCPGTAEPSLKARIAANHALDD